MEQYFLAAQVGLYTLAMPVGIALAFVFVYDFFIQNCHSNEHTA
ncbi:MULTISPECIES: hypothetical protein [Chitinophaga]|nr:MULTISPECIES: hypothetical protein [Chitinophaga]